MSGRLSWIAALHCWQACRGPSSPFGLRRGSLRYERACRAEAGAACEGLLGSELLELDRACLGCRQACRGPSSPFGLRRGSLRYERACRAEAGAACEGWWSQAGSNRRPRHCERRALPAELWPLAQPPRCERWRGSNRCHLQSAPTSSQERRNRRFRSIWSGTSLVCRRGEPISSSQPTPRVPPPCVPFSTSFSSSSISMSGC